MCVCSLVFFGLLLEQQVEAEICLLFTSHIPTVAMAGPGCSQGSVLVLMAVRGLSTLTMACCLPECSLERGQEEEWIGLNPWHPSVEC